MPDSEEWTESELVDIVVASGGEVGELSMKAMELCGMPTKAMQDSLDKIGEDPSSSPAVTE